MEKHDILHEFPDQKEKIHNLKVSDERFKRLFEEYHELNNTVHSIETGATPTTDERLNELRMKRVLIKDALAAYLNQ